MTLPIKDSVGPCSVISSKTILKSSGKSVTSTPPPTNECPSTKRRRPSSLQTSPSEISPTASQTQRLLLVQGSAKKKAKREEQDLPQLLNEFPNPFTKLLSEHSKNETHSKSSLSNQNTPEKADGSESLLTEALKSPICSSLKDLKMSLPKANGQSATFNFFQSYNQSPSLFNKTQIEEVVPFDVLHCFEDNEEETFCREEYPVDSQLSVTNEFGNFGLSDDHLKCLIGASGDSAQQKASLSNTSNSPEEFPFSGLIDKNFQKNFIDFVGWSEPNSHAEGFLCLEKENSSPRNFSPAKITNKPVSKDFLFCDETLSSPFLQTNEEIDHGKSPGKPSVIFDPLRSSPVNTITFTPINNRKKTQTRCIEPLECHEDEEEEDSDVDLAQFFDIVDITNTNPDPDENPTDSTKKYFLVLKVNLKKRSASSPVSIAFSPDNLDNIVDSANLKENETIGGGIQHPDVGIAKILKFWRTLEDTYYSFSQDHLGECVRLILINWLMETSCDMSFHRQTCQTAINYFDRFYDSVDAVPEDLHQPIAAVCLYIAAKKEEIELPALERFIDIASNATLTTSLFHAIEKRVVEVLDWNLCPPTYFDCISVFLRRAAISDTLSNQFLPVKVRFPHNSKKPKTEMSINMQFFQEVSKIIDVWIHTAMSLQFPPSISVASALCLVYFEKFEVELSSEDLQCITTYTTAHVSHCLDLMRDTIFHRMSSYPLPVFPTTIGENLLPYYQPQYPGLDEYLRSGCSPVNDELEHFQREQDMTMATLITTTNATT